MSELPEKQVKRLRSLIQEAETNLAAAKELLISIVGDDGSVVTPKNSQEDVSGKIVEGVFDGQIMIGPDGKSYPVPANYASKSKLVEGDILKLTIADDGGFIYKQIGSYSTTAPTTSKPTAVNTVFFWPASRTSASMLATKSLLSFLKTTLTPLGRLSKRRSRSHA